MNFFNFKRFLYFISKFVNVYFGRFVNYKNLYRNKDDF